LYVPGGQEQFEIVDGLAEVLPEVLSF